ncbi:MAG: nucleoside 2-deoxyribosyltransferase [Lentisphaeria bacterium]|nr:nucleoside 2-deoxyribosyltransferase [Lentisphaeria bacterium]
MDGKPITIYWAGDLFDFKDLTGNVEMAAAVEARSAGKYQVKLPQLSESNSLRTITAIRDADLELLFSCDCIVANFDGCDLDSGTVVEFCFAKMLDLPAVLLRTDFRTGCDQGPGGDPWNLMCSGYPRTNTVVLHGMQVFHQHYKGAEDWKNKLDSYRNDIAERVIHALDQSIAADPVFPVAVMEEQYARAAAAAGGSLPALFPRARIEELLASKMAKKIYR